jgi:hypothetical protein
MLGLSYQKKKKGMNHKKKFKKDEKNLLRSKTIPSAGRGELLGNMVACGQHRKMCQGDGASRHVHSERLSSLKCRQRLWSMGGCCSLLCVEALEGLAFPARGHL